LGNLLRGTGVDINLIYIPRSKKVLYVKNKTQLLKNTVGPGVVVYTCNLSYAEGKEVSQDKKS
jgi:hypothetical protein